MLCAWIIAIETWEYLKAEQRHVPAAFSSNCKKKSKREYLLKHQNLTVVHLVAKMVGLNSNAWRTQMRHDVEKIQRKAYADHDIQMKTEKGTKGVFGSDPGKAAWARQRL